MDFLLSQIESFYMSKKTHFAYNGNKKISRFYEGLFSCELAHQTIWELTHWAQRATPVLFTEYSLGGHFPLFMPLLQIWIREKNSSITPATQTKFKERLKKIHNINTWTKKYEERHCLVWYSLKSTNKPSLLLCFFSLALALRAKFE